jgi:hypothetical protein
MESLVALGALVVVPCDLANLYSLSDVQNSGLVTCPLFTGPQPTKYCDFSRRFHHLNLVLFGKSLRSKVEKLESYMKFNSQRSDTFDEAKFHQFWYGFERPSIRYSGSLNENID